MLNRVEQLTTSLTNCVTISGKHRQLCPGLPGDSRVVRGGSWNNNRDNARAAYRNNNNPDNRNDNNGFRVVLVVVRPTPYLYAHEEWVCPLFPRQLHALAWPARDGATSSVCPAIGSRFQFMLTDYGL